MEAETSYWKSVLHRVVVVVKALASRGMSLRGHEEKFGGSRNGNNMMLLEVIAEFDTFFASHIAKFGNPGSSKKPYLSSTTAEEITKAKYFSLIVVSTPDFLHIDQLGIVIRHVKEDFSPVERFLTFLPNTAVSYTHLDVYKRQVCTLLVALAI